MKRDREEILNAARRYFSSAGIRTASMQEVADVIHVSRSALYYHWGAKSDLLYELVMLVIDEFISRAGEIVSYPLPASQRLAVLIRTALRLESENPAAPLALLLRGDTDALKPEQRQTYIARRDEYEGYYRRLISEGIEAEEFRPVNVKLASFALIGMLENFDGWFNPDGTLSSDQVGDAFSDLFLAALASDRPQGPWVDENVTTSRRLASRSEKSAVVRTKA